MHRCRPQRTGVYNDQPNRISNWTALLVDFGSQIGECWCKLGAFVQFTYKAGLSAVPTVKISLATPFPLDTIPGNNTLQITHTVDYEHVNTHCQQTRPNSDSQNVNYELL